MSETQQNPYQSPQVENSVLQEGVRYGGFWLRVAAAMIDSLLIMVLTWPLLFAVYGSDFITSGTVGGGIDVLVNWVLPAVVVMIFWLSRSATPGKMALKLYIADADTLGKPGKGQLVGRYLGYFVAMLPLFLGIFWVGWDSRKQGFHDKLSKTVVLVGKPPWLAHP